MDEPIDEKIPDLPTNEDMPEGATKVAEETSATTEDVTKDDHISALEAQIAQLKAESQDNLHGWQRSRAEFANYKRRTSQELTDARERGATEALAKVLPIMDDFERALDNVPDDLQGHPWLNGTALILKNMRKVMDSYDIEVVDPVGQEFDPNLHEAVGMDTSDEYESGIVTATLQKGYRSGERVLRPALVRVAN